METETDGGREKLSEKGKKSTSKRTAQPKYYGYKENDWLWGGKPTG